MLTLIFFASYSFYETGQKQVPLKIIAKTRNSSIRTSRVLVQEFYPLVLKLSPHYTQEYF